VGCSLSTISRSEVLMNALSKAEPVRDEADEDHKALGKGMDVVVSESFALTPSLLQVEVVAVDNYYLLQGAGHRGDDVS